jgi:hypothetical protein
MNLDAVGALAALAMGLVVLLVAVRACRVRFEELNRSCPPRK